MTADVLMLDGARLSARRVLSAETVRQTHRPGDILLAELDQVERQVEREAEREFGGRHRIAYVYVTYETLLDPWEPEPAA